MNFVFRAQIAAAVSLAMTAFAAHAQSAAETTIDSGTLTLTTIAGDAPKAKRGGHVVLNLRGAVKDGWHVYALKQLQSGPTPLFVKLDPSELAKPAGAPTGSAATVAHDSAFGFDTPYYTSTFTLSLPVRLGSRIPAGRQAIPISVRFQTCNGQICQPPKTVHLSAPVTVEAG